jgi:tetratricopeptide (TPR) repeat protein
MRSFCRPLPSSWRRPATRALVLLLLLPAGAWPADAQNAPVAQESASLASTIFAASRALRTGQLETVEELTAPLPDVEAAVVLRARAASARGRYADAQSWLAPLAARAPRGDAALELGLLQVLRGQRAEAAKTLAPVLEHGSAATDDAALVRAARAARALGRFQQANDLFRDAAALAGNDPALQTEWGELLLEKHNEADASRSFRTAVQLDRTYGPALVGLGRTLADTNPPAARQLAQRALRANPTLESAHILLAELALDDRDRTAATAAVDAVLEVNPASLDALALQAAIAWLEDRRQDFDRGVAASLAVNPHDGRVFRIAGTHAAHHYRFEDAVALTRRALEIDDADPRAYAELGMHLLRTGDEAGAREALDRAFRDDPYDVVTYNLLALLDTLDRFVTVTDGPLVIRFHPDEVGVLREHAVPLAREALRALSARYGFEPQGPILIEIFPRHDDFAVRTLGLPGMIGALGACFGRVVTLDSPRARPPGTFNWQATLWHELAHVFTLQLSAQRVPRWLTEGISVYEEQRARASWGHEMQLRFVQALDAGEDIPLADLNAAFSDPEKITLAYYEASLLVSHIVETYGEEALIRLVRSYSDGSDTPEAVQRSLRVSLDALQESFSAAIDERFSAARAALKLPDDGALTNASSLEALQQLADAHPGSFPVQMALADAAEQAGEIDTAMSAYAAAAALLPMATSDEGPLMRMAKLARAAKDAPAAARALAQVVERDGSSIAAARELVELLEDSGNRELLVRAHERIAEVDPFDAASQVALGRRALEAGDAEDAVRWLRAAVAAGPRDAVATRCDLADAYLRLGARADAKIQTLQALELAPTYVRAQDLLLSIVDARP